MSVNCDDATKDEHAVLRRTLLSRLLDAVKQFQSHYGAKRELATDGDIRLSNLLEQIEVVLYHGIKRDSNSYIPFRHLTDYVSKFAGDAFSPDLNFWPCVQCILTEQEINRINSLKKINTDSGRVKAWLRGALNEKSLARYFDSLLTDKKLLDQFYEPWAFLRDPESSAILPQIAQGLNTIVFAISVDNTELNSARAMAEDTSNSLIEANKAPQPILALHTSQNRRLNSHPSTTKKRKPMINVVSFEESDSKFCDNSGRMTAVVPPESKGEVTADPHKMSALITAWNKDNECEESTERSDKIEWKDKTNQPGALIDSYDSDATVSSYSGERRIMGIPHELSKSSVTESACDNSPEPTILPSFNLIGGLRLDSCDDVFLPVNSNSIDESTFGDDESEEIQTKMGGSAVSSLLNHIDSPLGSEISAMSLSENQGEIEALRKEKQDIEVYYKSMLNETRKENEMLKSQLKSYVEAVRLLKEGKNISNFNGVEPGSEFNNQYEQKLVQVAEMHAEMSELNSHLMMQLNRTKNRMKRFRNEVINLRGALPSDYEDGDCQNGSGSNVNARSPVNIWIPSAFLTGKGTDVHHVYQVYLRVGNTEFNVYRRYADFRLFHDEFRKKDPTIAGLAFPPKKKIGKKEKKFVDERRKKLEEYLRKAINHIVFSFPEFQAVPVDRRSLSAHINLFRDA